MTYNSPDFLFWISLFRNISTFTSPFTEFLVQVPAAMQTRIQGTFLQQIHTRAKHNHLLTQYVTTLLQTINHPSPRAFLTLSHLEANSSSFRKKLI